MNGNYWWNYFLKALANDDIYTDWQLHQAMRGMALSTLNKPLEGVDHE